MSFYTILSEVLISFLVLIITYHILQIREHTIPRTIYQWSLGFLSVLLSAMITQLIILRSQRRDWWTETHCVTIGKVEVALLGISHTLFGLFLFARVFFVFKDFEHPSKGDLL
eukprot:UN01409